MAEGGERPLRVALVGPQSPPAGGMARQRETLSRHFSAAGFEVLDLITNPPWPRALARWRRLRAAPRLAGHLLRLWRAAGQVDIAHVMANSGWSWHLFAAPAIALFRARGVPVVVSYHGGLAESFLARERAWVLPVLSRADALVVPSGFLLAVFAHYGLAARVIPDTIDLARFSVPRQNHGAQIIVTRNLEPVYDIATALHAFAKVLAARPDARLDIAGSGPLGDSLAALAKRLGIDHAVTFHGRMEPLQIASLLSSADVLLNPSLADNLPNSVVEALAAGVPVVSTRVGGVPYLVEHEVSALLVPAGDAGALAAGMLRVLAEPALRARLTANGAEIARRHGWDQTRRKWCELYRELCTRRLISARHPARPDAEG